ncbi:uncharacterized protein F4807DRAFT_44106 [Annulohypoxylon truncatum]|uniref:uncharacterized protein n=1 Tax=Annulohypoxylon truncatum TaxID=327061 RepID=UPI00200809B6|nr:uncharacterized protein F4807DRAFT_44106 [Annulohypoxylon truncatum]KAI1210938.1 hypothetical protein F4807DRAFT_44106 [Annulohypoxylon truncatum]
MAIRYSVDALVFLRESPLCTKPSTLPPAEEWMGPPPETFRNSQGNKPGGERGRNNDNFLLDQSNRRLGVDRHASRNAGNAEDIILGPPRTTFSSATLSRANKPFDSEKNPKEADTRDRFAFRSRNGDADNSDRFRERDREGRNNFRRRGDADQDSEGWSTVKPRKSFGHEGAERFHGRMGDRTDRFGGDRRPRDQDDRDNSDRPRRAFGEFSKDKEGDEIEKPRRNGVNRNRAEQPWMRDNGNNGNGDASGPRGFDRFKSWRERNDDHQSDLHQDKPRERTFDRKWDRDRDHRQEREPEWLDEPAEEPAQAHTQEDFKKFMESMKAGKNPAKAEPASSSAAEASTAPEKVENEKVKVKSAPAIEIGPDKFFAAFGQSTSIETPGNVGEATKENAVPVIKPKSGSRFQKLFSSQEESKRQVEPPTPAASAPPPSEMNPLLAMTGAHPQNDTAEKVAFQALLQKLQKQTLQATTPPSSGFAEPPPNHAIASPGPYQPYIQERREEPLIRGPPQGQEIPTPRQHLNPQYAGMRSEQQVLQDLIGQRHLSQSQNAGRSDQPSRNSNSNAEFLMTLMQSARAAPEGRGTEQLAMRMPQPSRPAQILPTPDRDLDYHERAISQHQVGRSTNLPSFFDEAQLHHREQDSRPQQPTQILQRQPPPGLDQIHPSAWMQNSGQQMPPPGRPMIPPPGLAGNPRNGPIPGGFPPGNFPIGGFPPDGIAGPPRNMAPPPGFFGGPPPPGFIPPGIPGFQGPENVAFGFDHRGMPPPPGAFRRN